MFAQIEEFLNSDTALYIAIAVVAAFVVQRYFASKTVVTAQITKLQARATPEKRDYTREELKQYDGSDPTKSILLGVKGKIFDVSRGASFYGPGGSYSAFAGKDASRALAKSDTAAEVANNPNISDLTASELATLDDWYNLFSGKYEFVGNLKD